jgi:hypothetical protein
MSGRKDDKGKPPVTQLLRQFPNAIAYLAKVSEYGHKRYGLPENERLWDNWRFVEGAQFRYEQAIARHLLDPSDSIDESGFYNIAHAAWNTLAVLELILENGLQNRTREQNMEESKEG